MARTRADIETTIRERNPFIEVCDGECRQYTTGEPAYEAWIAHTVDEHAASDANQDEDADRRQIARDVQTALTLLDGTATLAQTRTILAKLIRYLIREGVIAP